MKDTFSAALCAAALLVVLPAAGCHRQPEETQTADSGTVAAPVETVPPHELNPEPRSVTVPEAAEATPAPPPSQTEIDTRERELAQRQADLDARERLLREREQARRRQDSAPPPQAREEAQAPEPEAEPAEPEAGEADADAEPSPEPEEAAEPAEAPRAEPVAVPAGTVMEVELLSTVSSATSRVGDTFRARISRDIEADGRVAIPAGSEVVGEVTDAVPLRKVGGQAKLTLRFTDLVLPGGSTVPIDASFLQQGRNETGRDAATIGGAAAGGAILGRILNKGSRGKGALIGAIIGAAAGTIIAARTPGEEVTLSAGSVVDLQLNESLRIRPRR